MPLARALSTLHEQTEHAGMRKVVDELHHEIQEGSSLAEALESRPDIFPVMHVSLVRAGETGGMLTEVLWRIVHFGEQDEELRGKALSALIYPIFLSVVSCAAVFVLLAFVFPRFVKVFDDFNASLPLPTRVVISVSEFMGVYWWAVLIVVAGLLTLAWRYRRSETGREQLDRFWLWLPVVGPLVQRFEMAKFARTLGTLFDNGVPVLKALSITADTLSNSRMRAEVLEVRHHVGEGAAISEAMRRSEVFPPLVVNMLAVGEESGTLGEVTQRIADAYEIEVERSVKAATALLEPVIIVFMGVVVGFLVIAMLLPMLTLSSQIR
jgi:type II secretory pathway component PulF